MATNATTTPNATTERGAHHDRQNPHSRRCAGAPAAGVRSKRWPEQVGARDWGFPRSLSAMSYWGADSPGRRCLRRWGSSKRPALGDLLRKRRLTMSAERRKQKEGPAQLPTAWPGSTREACGNHRRTHWHIASNRSPCSRKIACRSTSFAFVGALNGTGALTKPELWVARIYRNCGSKDRSERLAGGLCQPSRSSDRVYRRHRVGRTPCASARLRRSRHRDARIAWPGLSPVRQNTPTSPPKVT